MEVFYLGTWITLPGGTSVAFPVTIVIAFFFTMVLSRTAVLWTDRMAVAGVPLYTWVAGYLLLLLWPALTGDQLLGSNIRSVLLLAAGLVGGVWPLVSHK